MRLFDTVGHLRDEALLLGQDRALHGGALRRLDNHLDNCAACRLRRQALLEQDHHLHTAMQAEPAPMPHVARLRLQEALAEAASARRVPPQQSWRAMLLRPTMLLQLGTVAILLVLGATYRQVTRPLQGWMAAYDEKGPRPDHALTPGSTSPMTLAQVCSLDDENQDPTLPQEKQRAVFRAYGVDENSARAYQVDYLINPQLGGNDHMENLWPEPYQSTVWNAAAKDALETRLHGLVCTRQVDLKAAQREISSDWIAAYRKYFHTAQPSEVAASGDARLLALPEPMLP
jgi:hypothetical protein